MARPRNEELKQRIEDEAWAQFRAQGYDATSYASVAAACGISRNLVQYHFPRKAQLAMRFMEDVLAQAQAQLGYGDDELSGDFERILNVGVRFFETLLAEAGTRAFLRDIVRDRDLTEEVLAFNARWALERSGLPRSAEVPAAAMRSVIVHMGGFYELLYHCLKTDEPIAVADELAGVVTAFAAALDRP